MLSLRKPAHSVFQTGFIRGLGNLENAWKTILEHVRKTILENAWKTFPGRFISGGLYGKRLEKVDWETLENVDWKTLGTR